MSTELIKYDNIQQQHIQSIDNEVVQTSSGTATYQTVGAIQIKMDGNYAYWRPTASGSIDFIPFA